MSAKRQQAVAFFIQQGWTLEQSVGIVANLEAESGLRHDAVGDSGLAYGIAQWHPPRQSHFAGLMGKHIRQSSFEEQLAFVHAELQSTEKAAGTALAACTTAADAGACVSKLYERPADREGEAAKRALRAESIEAALEGELFPGSGIPTPPEAPKPPQTPDLPPYRPPESPMLPAFLLQLLPMITGAFTQGGQAQLQPITSKPADQIAPFLINLFSQVAGATGVLPQGQQIATNEQAVAAAAEFNKLKTTNAALIADIEKRALSYLADIAPLFDRLAAADKAENEARIAGTDAAAKRATTERWDMTPWLVWIAGGTATVLVLALLGAIIWQATTGDRNIDVALIGLAGPLLAIAMGVWREIFSYRFDGSPSSSASNAIAQQIAVASKRAV